MSMSFAYDLARLLAAVALVWVVSVDGPLWLEVALVVFVLIGLLLRLWPGWWRDQP